MNTSKSFRASYHTTKAAIKAANATGDALSTAGNTVRTAFSDIVAGFKAARSPERQASLPLVRKA